MDAYRAPAWLPGGQAQTIYAALAAPRPRISYRRERWDTPDGDFIDLDWVVKPAPAARRFYLTFQSEWMGRAPGDKNTPDVGRYEARTTPLVVMFHGLEGSSRSHYARALMHAVAARRWGGGVVHFRGCSGELNRLPRAYHSGDSTEIDWILRRLKRDRPAAPLFAIGVSLGGNALLKWLGEQRDAAPAVVGGVATVSAPVDLTAAGNALDHGFNLIYVQHFLATMKRKSLAKLERFPGLLDRKSVCAARTLREFDDAVTAPLHGFKDTDDYWMRASAKPLLGQIRVPTLMVNARNDPFLPRHALPQPHEVSQHVAVEFPAAGGHAGFVGGAFPGNLDWLPRRVLEFFGASGETPQNTFETADECE